MLYRVATCLVLFLACCLVIAQTVTVRKLSNIEGYREVHWFPDGEHILLIHHPQWPEEYSLAVTDRYGNSLVEARKSDNIPFYAPDRLYVGAPSRIYSVRADGLYAERLTPDWFRALHYASPDGRWFITLDGIVTDEDFKQIVDIQEVGGYNWRRSTGLSGAFWQADRLYVVSGDRVNGQVHSHVLEIELTTGTVNLLAASPTGDWVDIQDIYPNGDLLLLHDDAVTYQRSYKRCTIELECTVPPGLINGGRFSEIALSRDAKFYGGFAYEPGFDPDQTGAPPSVVVGLPDGTWDHFLMVAPEPWFDWSPTRNELLVVIRAPEPPYNIHPLIIEVE